MGKTAGGAEDAEGGLTGRIIGAAIRVLEELKPGLDEKLHENALVMELAKLGLQPGQQKSFPVHYDGNFIGRLVPDRIVKDVVVDAKVVTAFAPDHMAQMLGYLNITGYSPGLPLNFRYRKLQIKRVILNQGGPPGEGPLIP